MNTRLFSVIVCGVAFTRTTVGQTPERVREYTSETAHGEAHFAADMVNLPPPINFQLLERRKIKLSNRSIFLNRVALPILPPAPASTRIAPEPILTSEQRQAFMEREAKKSVMLILSVTVYDRQISELRWSDEHGSHRVFSSIDFNLIAGLGGFETSEISYTLMMGLGIDSRAARIEYNQSLTPEELKNDLQLDVPPPATDFSPVRAEYIVAEDATHRSPTSDDLAALNALHVYYDANKQRLAEEYMKRQTTRIERERWLKAHPPVPKDIVVNYWRKPNELPTAEGAK